MRSLLISTALITFGGCLCGGEPVSSHASVVSDSGTTEWDAGPPPMVSTTGCWSAPLVLAPAGEAWAPRLAALPTGEALVMWSSFDGGLSAQRFTPDGGRGRRVDLDAAPAVDDLLFSANQRGDAVALWLTSPDGGWEKRLLASRLRQDGTWGPLEEIDDGPAMAPHSAVTSNGEIVIIWAVPNTITGFPSLRARRFDGVSWLAPETLSPFGWQFGSVELTAGDVAVAAWTQWGPPTFEPVATSSIWTAGTRRDRVMKAHRVVHTLGIDALASTTDRAVSFLANSSTEFELHRFADDTWQLGPRVLRTDEAIPLAGADAKGRLTVWSTTTSAAGTTLVATTETDGGWSLAREVNTQREPIRFIISATNSLGSGLVAWSRERTLAIARTEADAGQLDLIDGLVVVPGRSQPQLAISSSGARWILGQLPEAWPRSVLLFCP